MNSYEKGSAFEKTVSKILNQKLGLKLRRDSRSGANWHSKADIKDFYQELPLHIEVKDDESLQLKKWSRKTGKEAGYKIPTIVFNLEGVPMAVLPFANLVDFLSEIKEQRLEITELRQPIKEVVSGKWYFTCRNGHIVGASGKCNQKDCVYGPYYKKPKARK